MRPLRGEGAASKERRTEMTLSIAAQGHHDVGLFRIVIAVEPDQLRPGVLGFRDGARDKGDPVVALGAGHGGRGLVWALKGRGCAERRLYDLDHACRDRLPAGFHLIVR